jgi:hypothetical protein
MSTAKTRGYARKLGIGLVIVLASVFVALPALGLMLLWLWGRYGGE